MTITYMSTAAAPSIGGGLRPCTGAATVSPLAQPGYAATALPVFGANWGSPSSSDLGTPRVDLRAGNGRQHQTQNSITAAPRIVAVPAVNVIAVPAGRIRTAKLAAPPRGVPR